MNRSSDLSRYLVGPDWSLADVMRQIDQAESRVVFVEREGRIVGSLSDGDIRRAVLRGLPLSSLAEHVMHTDVVCAQANTRPAALHALFGHGVSAIPIVDADGKLIDILFEQSRSMIPVAEPEITAREFQLVNECLTSGWISSTGRFVLEFEEMFSQYTGAVASVTVSNGTTGLVLALKALGVGPGDEVLVPDLTFGASANAVVQVGAIPVLVDVGAEDWCIDPTRAREAITTRTRAIMPVHLYGRAANMDAVFALADEFGLLVVEDCAEAVGTHDAHGHVGTRSDAGVFSFFANKTVTTGEGGMVCFRSAEVAERAKSMRSHGFSPKKRYWHDEWGTNFRLTNLQAAIGVAQMERVERTVERKLQIAGKYRRLLAHLTSEGLALPIEPAVGRHTHWLYTVLLPTGVNSDEVAQEMLEEGVECRRVFYPLHAMPAFSAFSSDEDYPVSELISERGLSLPSWPGLTDEDLATVASCLTSSIVRQLQR
jgi:perosamine synthetase